MASYFRRLVRSTGEFVERARRGPHGESSRMLFRFRSAEDLAQWSTFSDAELGGRSTAALELAPPAEEAVPQASSAAADSAPGPASASASAPAPATATTHPTAVLRGHYSTEVGAAAHERLKRSGFAGITCSPRPGGQPMDLEDFDALVFRVRGDGRQYIASIRCENWLVDERTHDVWQAFLFARKGEWSEVEVPLSRFMLTWKGRVVEEVVELNAKRITSLGISLAGGEQLQQEGPYQLGLDWIKARNTRAEPGLDEEEAAAEEAAGGRRQQRRS